ncbi:MAG: metallophosphoesterase [Sulfurimonas sp.]|nr:metallophosphoesterase [Sulfurimonas sp.]MDQ7059940.1 metallophosphoesterase [Sulfurimonas sp.]
MFHSQIQIKEGAFFITDAHYSSSRPELLDFLKAIASKKLLPTQIFFMGDIFDALFGGVEKTYQVNIEAINIINKLSQTIEIIYLEGNHDFNLASLFPNVNVFKIKNQPLQCLYDEKKVILAHGDFDAPLGYQIYTAIVRNKLVLKFLSLFEIYILKKLDKYLSMKNDCKELPWFEDFISKRINNTYASDYFIEGHFHQNKTFELTTIKYINLGAFACNQRYFIVKSSKEKELLEENIFSKET